MADIEQLVPLFDGYRQFYRKPSDPTGASAFLTARLRRGEAVVFVAEAQYGASGTAAPGNAVGFTLLYPLFSSVRMAPVWLLNDLFVDAAARRQGIGEALLGAADRFARGAGAAGLELATEKDNAAAKSVYERLGWSLQEDFDHYSLDLTTP